MSDESTSKPNTSEAKPCSHTPNEDVSTKKRNPQALIKREAISLHQRNNRVRVRKIKHLKSLVRAKHNTFLTERAAHRTTLLRLHAAQKIYADFKLICIFLKGKLKARRKGERSVERLKAAYLVLHRRFEELVEEKRLVEGQMRLFGELPRVLRECREGCERLERGLQGMEGGRSNVV